MFGKHNEIMERLGSIKLWMIDINEKLAAIQNELSEHNKLIQEGQRMEQAKEQARRKHQKLPAKVEEVVTNEAI